MLGKRKRRASLEKKQEHVREVPVSSDYQKVLREHFESIYEPLETNEAKPNGEEVDSEASGEWEGLSDNDDIEKGRDVAADVEVVDHSIVPKGNEDGESRSARKAFMTSKLPSAAVFQALRKTKPLERDEESTTEAALIKNDLALQRLLRESKLLSSARNDGPHTSLELSGKSRHRALDTHLQGLGAKTSLHTQKTMPRAQRIGITKKAAERDVSRRAEAKEAGIVLEKMKGAPSKARLRERGVGAPGVGKFRGGTLTLSAKDVRSIQGTPSRTKGKSAKKGRR